MSQTRTFTVMSRQWCHLCHELVDQLEPLARESGWAIEVFDVDADPTLEARWSELVPVLLVGDRVLCHYHLDESAVRAWIAATADGVCGSAIKPSFQTPM